jgi:hypothetical protein
MARGIQSLLAGRNTAPLSQQEEQRVSNTIMGLETKINFRVVSGESTRFRVFNDEDGMEVAEIIFGADVFPGRGVVDPNSSLSMKAAIAHELSHYFRWHDKTEYEEGELAQLDETITSLEAILRYYQHLNDNERQQLVRDAIQRVQIFVGQR